MKRIRESTVRVTAVDGTTWEGHGEGLTRAARDLVRRHRAGQPAADQGEVRWRLTPPGQHAPAPARRSGTDSAAPGDPPTGASADGMAVIPPRFGYVRGYTRTWHLLAAPPPPGRDSPPTGPALCGQRLPAGLPDWGPVCGSVDAGAPVCRRCRRQVLRFAKGAA
jgi:hypothetical protein